MRFRVLLALGALAALAAFVAVRGAGRGVADGASLTPTPSPLPAREAAPTATPIDTAEIRDIFRYADEPAVTRRSGPDVSPPTRGGIALPSRARLVGLVRRGDHVFAALAIDGDVLLLGPGESGSGYTVLDMREEGVHLRGPDGREETLALP